MGEILLNLILYCEHAIVIPFGSIVSIDDLDVAQNKLIERQKH